MKAWTWLLGQIWKVGNAFDLRKERATRSRVTGLWDARGSALQPSRTCLARSPVDAEEWGQGCSQPEAKTFSSTKLF